MPAAKGRATGTNGHRVIDLDAARTARAEIEQEPVTVKIGGKRFKLPAELPADFALLIADERLHEALRALFGKDAEGFFALRPSMPDVQELVDQISSVYGVESGE